MENHPWTAETERRLDKATRQLVHPERERELEVLLNLGREPLHAASIAKVLGIDHPEKMHRALRNLEKIGLVERFYDKDFDKRGNAFKLSPMGALAQERVILVREFISAVSKISLADPTHLMLKPIGGTAGGLTKFSISLQTQNEILDEISQLAERIEEEAKRFHREESRIRKRLNEIKTEFTSTTGVA